MPVYKQLPKGIGEVPMELGKCTHCGASVAMSDGMRSFLTQVKQGADNLQRAKGPLNTPTNVQVTPQAFSNMIQFTRPPQSDFFEILWNTTPNLSGAQIAGTSTSNQYVDYVGQAGVKRFYWVRARNYQGGKSIESTPIAATTLAAGTSVPFPHPPPAGQVQAVYVTKGRLIYVE